MEDISLQQLESLIRAAFAEPSDEPLKPSPLQVHDGVGWIPASREVWAAYTGPRAVWGVEHHGPVYAMGAPEDAPPWDGPRVCRCPTCQQHVAPSKRPN